MDLPVRVAAVNDYDLVVAGVANLLENHPDQLIVVDRVIVGEPVDGPVDVALFDTYGRIGVAEKALRALVAMPEIRSVAIFSLQITVQMVEDGRQAGATGFISKALPGDAIADALVRVAGGEDVVATADSGWRSLDPDLDWPGRDDGLTERESQVLVLAAEGLSNREIAKALYLSFETVKGHMSQIFEKLQVRNRVEAAAWAHRSDAFTRQSEI